MSKDRLPKIIASLKHGGGSGTLAQGAVAANVDGQSFAIGSIVSFLFEDYTFPGGMRFWLGKISQMIIIPSTSSGKKTSIASQRLSINNIPENLHLSCCWMRPSPRFCESSATKLTATEYQFLPALQSLQRIDAKFIINVVELAVHDTAPGVFVLADDDLALINDYVITQHKVRAAPQTGGAVRGATRKRSLLQPCEPDKVTPKAVKYKGDHLDFGAGIARAENPNHTITGTTATGRSVKSRLPSLKI